MGSQKIQEWDYDVHYCRSKVINRNKKLQWFSDFDSVDFLAFRAKTLFSNPRAVGAVGHCLLKTRRPRTKRHHLLSVIISHFNQLRPSETTIMSDDESFDSFEYCFGFKMKSMFKGSPKCPSCRRPHFNNQICDGCEERMELQMMAREEAKRTSREEAKKKSQQNKSPKLTLADLRNEAQDEKKQQNIKKNETMNNQSDDDSEDNDIALSKLAPKKKSSPARQSPAAKMTVANIPTFVKVTPNAKPPQKKTLTVINPYAKPKSIPKPKSPPIKAKRGVKMVPNLHVVVRKPLPSHATSKPSAPTNAPAPAKGNKYLA